MYTWSRHFWIEQYTITIVDSRHRLFHWRTCYDPFAIPYYLLNYAYITYLVIGIFFGIIMFKSEAASWFRIYEIFQFGSFHMYAIIGSALVLGIQVIKRKSIKPLDGSEMSLQPKKKSVARYLIGGIIFGLGWALVGACPCPMYILAGAGYISVLLVILGAVFGTFLYGMIKDRLPH